MSGFCVYSIIIFKTKAQLAGPKDKYSSHTWHVLILMWPGVHNSDDPVWIKISFENYHLWRSHMVEFGKGWLLCLPDN